MTLRKCADIAVSDNTQESVYRRRREWLKTLRPRSAHFAGGLRLKLRSRCQRTANILSRALRPELKIATRRQLSTTEPQISYQDATHYNNYFGTGNADPTRASGRFLPKP